MKSIEEIIKAIDEGIIESGLSTASLKQANNSLVRKGCITIKERSDQVLKETLEKGLIPHAYQTKTKPIQWEIPLSQQGKGKLNDILNGNMGKEVEVRIRKNRLRYQKFTRRCSWCKKEIEIPYLKFMDKRVDCPYCGVRNKNPYRKEYKPLFAKKKQSAPLWENEINNTHVYWGIVIVIGVIIFIAIALKDNSSTSASSTLYYVNTDTYAGKSKQAYNNVFNNAAVGDYQAVSSLERSGQIVHLRKGAEVYLVKSHFTYCIVRRKGSNQKLYVVTDHITKK